MIVKIPSWVGIGHIVDPKAPPDVITIDDAIDNDSQRLMLAASDLTCSVVTIINRTQAQQIVDHLTRVFALEKKA